MKEGNNSAAHCTLHLRFPSLSTDAFLYSLPRRLPAEFLQHVATYIALLLVLYCILHFCNLGSLHLVLLLLAPYTGGKAGVISISYSDVFYSTWILGYRDLLRCLRLARPALPLLEFECK